MPREGLGTLALFRQESGGAEGEQGEELRDAARAEPLSDEPSFDEPARDDAEPEAARPTPEAYDEQSPVESVYCENAGTIVPLDQGFCRACSRQVTEGDGVHRPVTPDLLGQLSYATTEVPEAEPQGEEAAEDAEEEDGS